MTNDAVESSLFEFQASDGEPFRFASRAEAIKYANDERQKWLWLSRHNLNNELGGVLSVIARILTPLDPVAILQPSIEATRADADATIRAGLGAYFGWAPAIHSRSQLQPFVLQIAHRNEREAIWTLAWLLYRAGKAPGVDSIGTQYPNLPGMYAGMASAWQWDGQSLIVDSATKALEGLQGVASNVHLLHEQVASTANSARSSNAALSAMAEEGATALKRSTAELLEFSNSLLGKLDEVVKDRGDELESKWKELTTTYAEVLKLKAPAKYWGEKRDSHRSQSLRYAIASAGIAIGGGAGLCWVYYRLLGTNGSSGLLPPFGELLPCIVLAVVFLWVLRTFMRLTMSHVHLTLDAEEREVMVQCYLAMTNEGETSGDERGALFAAIFRPTGDGIVKDESPPIPMWEMLKATKPQSG